MKRTRTPRPATPRLVAYVRVSTQDQADSGLSLSAQRARIAAHLEAQGLALLRVEEDAGKSGSLPPHRRPALARALAAVRAGEAEGIVVLKLDRLSRTTRDVLDMTEAADREGWRLVSVSESLDTGSASGRFVVTILAALAEMERAQIGERTSVAMDRIAQEGRARSYRLPFGFRTDGGEGATLEAGDRSQLVEDDAEQAMLARMLAMREAGDGAHRIAGALNAEGTKNPRTRGPWSTGTVAAILRTVDRRAQALGGR